MTARTSQIVLIFAAFLTGLVIFSGVFLYATGNFGGGGPATSAIGGPFKLVDQNGNPHHGCGPEGKAAPGILRLYALPRRLPDHAF